MALDERESEPSSSPPARHSTTTATNSSSNRRSLPRQRTLLEPLQLPPMPELPPSSSTRASTPATPTTPASPASPSAAQATASAKPRDSKVSFAPFLLSDINSRPRPPPQQQQPHTPDAAQPTSPALLHAQSDTATSTAAFANADAPDIPTKALLHKRSLISSGRLLTKQRQDSLVQPEPATLRERVVQKYHQLKQHISRPPHFEGLDFEVFDNEESDRSIAAHTSISFRRSNGVVRYLIAAITATMVALIYKGMNKAIERLIEFKNHDLIFEITHTHDDDLFKAWALSTLFSAGMTTIAFFLVLHSPAAAGSGLPEVIGYLNGVKIPGLVSFRTLIVKIIGTITSVGAGLFCDPEGPTIHIGATLGVVLTRETSFLRLMLSNFFASKVAARTSIASASSSSSIDGSGKRRKKSSIVVGTKSFCNSVAAGIVVFASFFSPTSLRSNLKKLWKFRIAHNASHRVDRDNILYAVVGAAAGVAAAFHSPLAGVVFAVEEATSFFHPRLIYRCFFAASISYWVLLFVTQGTLLNTNSLVLYGDDANCNVSFTAGDLLMYIILGIICGVLGALFNRIFIVLASLREKYVNSFVHRRWTEAMLVVIITSCFVVFVPYNEACIPMSQSLDHLADINLCSINSTALNEVCIPASVSSILYFYNPSDFRNESIYNDSCKPWPLLAELQDLYPMHQVVDEELSESFNTTMYKCYYEWASLLQVTPTDTLKNLLRRGTYNIFSMSTLASFFFIYFFLTQMTAGLSIPASAVLPGLIIGASLGRFIGMFVNRFVKLPLNIILADPGLFAVIGAGAFWAAIARVTLTITIIMVEATQSSDAMPGLIIAIVVAVYVANLFSPGLYHSTLKILKIPFIEHAPHLDLQGKRVIDIMSAPVVVLPVFARAKYIRKVLDNCTHNGFPIVEDIRKSHQPGGGVNMRTSMHHAPPSSPGADTHGYTHHLSKSACETSEKLLRHGKLVGFVLRYQLEVALFNTSSSHELNSKVQQHNEANPVSADTQQPDSLAVDILDDNVRPSTAMFRHAPSGLLHLDETVYHNPPEHPGSSIRSVLRSAHHEPVKKKSSSLLIPDVVLDLSRMMHRAPTTVLAMTPAPHAFNIFRHLGLRHLVVVDQSYHVVGIITRVDLIEDPEHYHCEDHNKFDEVHALFSHRRSNPDGAQTSRPVEVVSATDAVPDRVSAGPTPESGSLAGSSQNLPGMEQRRAQSISLAHAARVKAFASQRSKSVEEREPDVSDPRRRAYLSQKSTSMHDSQRESTAHSPAEVSFAPPPSASGDDSVSDTDDTSNGGLSSTDDGLSTDDDDDDSNNDEDGDGATDGSRGEAARPSDALPRDIVTLNAEGQIEHPFSLSNRLVFGDDGGRIAIVDGVDYVSLPMPPELTESEL